MQRPRDDTAVSAIPVYLEISENRSLRHRCAEISEPEASGAAAKPLALPRRGRRSRASGTTVPVIAAYRQRPAKPQQPYPSRVSSGISTTSSETKQLRHGRAGDCCISTANSETTAKYQVGRSRRLVYINSNRRSNGQHDSRVINRCISTATAICHYRYFRLEW